MTRAGRFKQIDVKRAIEGATQAGRRVEQFTIDRHGNITIILDGATPGAPANPWDKVLED